MTDPMELVGRLEKYVGPERGNEIQIASDIREAAACIREMVEWRDRTKIAYAKSNDQVCQSLGKALGYPWFKDDQVNFPRSTEADGVCVGEHVAESIADEAAKIITETTQWRDISTFTGSGQNESVMVAVPNSEGGFIVGEAWRCVMAEDDDYRGLSGWWWAGTAPGDYNHDPIRDMNHGDPTHWLPLPPAPGAEA
ncbi:hypothetical protein [Brevundimonas diminuta]|uniref:hypothetical protein n=1 Tax=Brevundimonas diminuta TaxID=293 RepID=UPI003D9A90DC